jgi:hypothetical protein
MLGGEVAMSCKHVQERLTTALAAGDAKLAAELATHVQNCDACHSFYQTESGLLLAMDTSLRTTLNQPAPPALLPRVRERLSETAPARTWVHALLPATAVMLFAGLIARPVFHHRSATIYPSIASVQPNKTERTSSTRPQTETPQVVTTSPQAPKKPQARSSFANQPVSAGAAAMPEILIDEDESRGLKLLTSTVYQQPEVGKALLRPIATPASVAQPIAAGDVAPLEVASLEIQPLPVEDR